MNRREGLRSFFIDFYHAQLGKQTIRNESILSHPDQAWTSVHLEVWSAYGACSEIQPINPVRHRPQAEPAGPRAHSAADPVAWNRRTVL